jgi:hypothetical protein
MSQEEKEAIPVSVVALRADGYSQDGNVVISLRTKFSSAERKYSVPIECFHDLIVDLQRLNSATAREPYESFLPPEPTMATE